MVMKISLVCLLGLILACGGGGGGSSDPGTQGDILATDQTPLDQLPTDQVQTEQVTTDLPVENVTFKAKVLDFQTKQPVEGADVVVLENDSGKETNTNVKSGQNGVVEIQLPKGKLVGFKVSKEKSRDTYQFGIASDAQDETLWLVSELTYKMAPAMAGLTVDETKGIVAGSIYFLNNGQEEHVGCATVVTDPSGDIRYFNPKTGLPANKEDAPMTSKKIAYFVAANIPAGKITMKAMVKDKEVGVVETFSYAKSISIQNIYVNTDKNPTPEDCNL